MSETRPPSAWERYAWVAGIVFVLATVAEAVVGFTGVKINQNDSAAKIAGALADHRKRVLLLAYLSVLYAAAFPIYLSKLHRLLRGPEDRAGFLAPLVLIGGTVFVVLHAVSDVGIYALLGAKLATYGAQHDHGLSYALYLMTFALDSVGDLFGQPVRPRSRRTHPQERCFVALARVDGDARRGPVVPSGLHTGRGGRRVSGSASTGSGSCSC